jgi:Holliday junction resolvase
MNGGIAMAKNSKRKGKTGELELAKKLREYGYSARRSVQYNGKEEEGQADLLGLPGIHIECERTERFSLYEAMDQAKRDSKGTGNMPAVFHRKNHCDWVVVLSLDDFMKIYSEYEAGFDFKGAQDADNH